MRFMNTSNARKNLADLVSAPDRTVLTRDGEPVAVLVPIADYRSLVTAQALARDAMGLSQAVAAHRRVQSGDLDNTERVGTAVEHGARATERAGTASIG